MEFVIWRGQKIWGISQWERTCKVLCSYSIVVCGNRMQLGVADKNGGRGEMQWYCMRKTEEIQSCIGRVELYWPSSHESRQVDREERSWEHPPESKMPANDLSPYYTLGKSQPRHETIGNNASWIVLLTEESSFLSITKKVQINSTT